MNEVTLRAPAKINLSIDVTGRLPNGYHTVEMIMQSIGLCDIVTVKKRQEGISLSCVERFVPSDQRNIAWKAAEAFFQNFSLKGGAHITIEKKIPVAAGLAGGSTDAAAVLKALNLMYGKPFSHEKLVEISKKLGADVAFCLKGGTQLAKGIGDELTKLNDFPSTYVVLVKPDFPVSTPWVYKNLNLNELGERPDTFSLIKAIERNDVIFTANGMRNVLESVTIKEHPQLGRIIDKIMSFGALGSRMSGSGPTVFGIFDDEGKAFYAKKQLENEYVQVIKTETIGRGD